MHKPMKSSLNVKLKPQAEIDLSKIHQYSLRKFGKKIATNYTKDIDSAFNNIANNPESGQYCHNIKQNLCKYIIKSHVVFFIKMILQLKSSGYCTNHKTIFNIYNFIICRLPVDPLCHHTYDKYNKYKDMRRIKS